MHEAARPIRTHDLIGCHGNRAQIDISGSKPLNEIVAMTTAILSKKLIFSLSFSSSLSLSLSSLSLFSLFSLSLFSLSLSSLSLSLSLALPRSLSLSIRSFSLAVYPLLSYRPFASSAENRTRASRFGGGEPTTTLANGRCRG